MTYFSIEINHTSLKLMTLSKIKDKQGVLNNDKSIIHLPRQQCAFSKESSKYVGCEILKQNFYTRFIPIFKDFGL